MLLAASRGNASCDHCFSRRSRLMPMKMEQRAESIGRWIPRKRTWRRPTSTSQWRRKPWATSWTVAVVKRRACEGLAFINVRGLYLVDAPMNAAESEQRNARVDRGVGVRSSLTAVGPGWRRRPRRRRRRSGVREVRAHEGLPKNRLLPVLSRASRNYAPLLYSK